MATLRELAIETGSQDEVAAFLDLPNHPHTEISSEYAALVRENVQAIREARE